MLLKKLAPLWSAVEKSRLGAAGVALAMFALVFAFSFSRPYEHLELTLYDIRFRIKPSTPQWEHLTFVDMEDNSIEQIGKFPWPRNVYTRGLDVMRSAGSRLTAFDIEFPNESPVTVDAGVMKALKSRTGAKAMRGMLDKVIVNNDEVFAGGLARYGRGILPFSFQNMELKESESARLRRAEIARARAQFRERASVPVPPERRGEFAALVDPARMDILYPIPELIASARGFGFVDSDFDVDGVARKVRLVRVFKDRLYFNLSLMMLMDLCGVAKEQVAVFPGSRIVLANAWNPRTQVRGDIVIPIDRSGMVHINWAGKYYQSFNHVPYYAFLEYPDVRDAVYGIFEQANPTAWSERASLARILSVFEADYQKGDDGARRALWPKILAARQRIAEIERAYLAPMERQIETLNAQLATADDPALRRQLAERQNELTAMTLVQQVENLRGHALLIGLTATASHDIGPIPLDNNYPMVGTYHTIVNMVLAGAYIVAAPAAVNYLLMLLVALVIALAVQRLSARLSVMVIAASFFVLNAAVILLFALGPIWVDQLGLNLALVLPSMAVAGIKFIREESQKKFIKEAFAHYMAPGVIDQIIQNPDLLQLGGENRRLTIFFSDVAGFTSISERITPNELVTLLNEYLSEMSDIVMKYDGTVDKFEGDAVMAFYGAPYHFPDHAAKACLAAIEMQERLVDMRAAWQKQNKDQLFVRIGMNTGDVVVGNMGSKTRMDYTVMGDAVNLAARLEGVNKTYGTGIIVSEFTYREAKDSIEVRHLDRIRVKGKEEPITIYELVGRAGRLADPVRELLACFDDGLRLFNERNWKQARQRFRDGLRINPDDGPCRVYADRCAEFMVKPPSRNWDGVYRFTTK